MFNCFNYLKSRSLSSDVCSVVRTTRTEVCFQIPSGHQFHNHQSWLVYRYDAKQLDHMRGSELSF